jgi:hypothetical protein
MLQIDLRDLQIHRRLQHRFVFGVKKSKGGSPVIGVQAFLLASRIVVDVIPPAIPATVKPEFLFHSCCSLSQR